MAALDEGSVTVVVTSPPHNIGVNYRTYEDSKSQDEYLKWIRNLFRRFTAFWNRKDRSS